MSKQAKVKMADILIRAGYNKRKSLLACGYPFVESVNFIGTIPSPPPSEMIVAISEDEKILQSKAISFPDLIEFEKKPLMPGVSRIFHTEAFFVNVRIKYQRTKVDNQYIQSSGRYIPPVPTWPIPEIFKIDK